MKTIIGIDAHHKTCTYSAKTELGEVLELRTIPSTRESLDELRSRYPDARIILEASSVSHWIYRHLHDTGTDIRLIHPVNIRRTLGRKSDELDAGFLVDAHLIDALRECYVPPQDIQELRDLARRRTFLVRERTKMMNHIHGALKRRGATYPSGRVFAKKNRAWLLEQDRAMFQPILGVIEALDSGISEDDREFAHHLDQRPEIQWINSIPGFGPISSLTLFAEIGDIHRFPNAEALTSYFGLVPGESQSGETMHRGRITRQGSSLARWVVTQSAWSHVRHCPESSATKKNKRLAKRIGKKKAIVATARTLIKITYHLLKDERVFEADR